MDNSCLDPNTLFKKSSRRLVIDRSKRSSDNGWMSPPHVSVDNIGDGTGEEISGSKLFIKADSNEGPLKPMESSTSRMAESASSLSKDSAHGSLTDETTATREFLLLIFFYLLLHFGTLAGFLNVQTYFLNNSHWI